MMNLGLYNGMMNEWGFGFYFTMLLVMSWSLVWKGWALWVASHKESKPWFIALLIINTMGILEILYIFVFSKMDKKK
jgi:hypothetical protein